MKYLLTILLVIVGLASYSQSFNYAYFDPCDGNLKTVAVPLGQNQIAVTYFNQVKSFDLIDLTNGVFDAWVKNTYNTYRTTSPCAGVGITNVITQSQGTTITLTGIINTVANLSFPSPNAPDPNEPPATPDIDLSGDIGDGGGTGGDISGSDAAGEGSDVMSGTSNSIKSSDGGGSSSGGSKSSSNNNKSNNQKQNALKPTVIGSSDLVAYSSADKTRGGKISGGYTSTRWDGLRTSGILFDYSTQIQGPNITGFYGWIGKKRTTLLSNTVSIGFEGKGALYNSVAFGQVVNWAGLK
jgi:hypothetical protein